MIVPVSYFLSQRYLLSGFTMSGAYFPQLYDLVLTHFTSVVFICFRPSRLIRYNNCKGEIWLPIMSIRDTNLLPGTCMVSARLLSHQNISSQLVPIKHWCVGLGGLAQRSWDLASRRTWVRGLSLWKYVEHWCHLDGQTLVCRYWQVLETLVSA